MRKQLQGASSPLNANLESVLPGVHERLDVHQKTSEDIHGIVSRIERTQQESIERNTQDSAIHLLESEINSMFRRIRSSIHEGITESPSIHQQATSPIRTEHTRIPEFARNNVNELPTIPITYSSIHQLYDHWNGEGEYEYIYSGGIARLESEKGSSWRKSWDNSANKRLSKVKAIISAIHNESKANNMPIADVLTTWESVYSDDCNGKISNFHAWVVANGKIQVKRARGKARDQ